MVSPVTTSVSPVTNIITRDNFAPSYDNIIFHASQKVRNTSHVLLDIHRKHIIKCGGLPSA